jgi:hypothetical protein
MIDVTKTNIINQIHNAESRKKLKILFYHAGVDKWFYPAALQFKTYIELNYPDTAQHLEWCVPIQLQLDDQDLIAAIRDSGADVLCTGHYLWNHDFLVNQLSKIKSQLPKHVKIIAGGPSIDVNADPEFFDKYPYIDYAVFAAGEQAIADILTHLIFDKPMIAFNTSNCAWRHPITNKIVVAEYKFVKMMEISPLLHNKQFFSEMVNNFFEKHKDLWFPYTLTRGCPYSCTFCDWNSGFGNKVSRRKNTYQQEVDLFHKLRIKNVYLADANVGQYEEDVQMVEYFAEKNIKENAGFHIGGNFSKLKKENNLKIFHAMGRGKLVNRTFNISVQDINPEILKNIDRPDVGWDVHVAMANELRQSYPHIVVKAQLIYCLPGQTISSWRKTIGQVAQNNIFPIVFLNEPLPASPARYDPTYQERFQFEYVTSSRMLRNGHTVYSSLIPKKSSSFTQTDIPHMSIISSIYIALASIKLAIKQYESEDFDVETVADGIISSPNYSMLHENLLRNWIDNNNFYYTINFDGSPEKIGDTGLFVFLLHNNTFLKMAARGLPAKSRKTFFKLIMDRTIGNFFNKIAEDFD